MQKYYDCHTHSYISFDGNISIAKTCALAYEQGAAGLTFTEHAMLEDDEACDNVPDKEAYVAQLEQARAAFPDLELKMGLELDLNPHRQEDINKLLQEGQWDFVLGSVHELFGHNITAYDGRFGNGQSVKKAYQAYFGGLYERVKAVSTFDALGHLDLLRRDRRYINHPFAYGDHAEVLDELLKLLISRGQGLEVNTAGWRYGMEETHPSKQVLRRYCQLGGEVITCGSDCHRSADVFSGIKRGYEMIKEAGFSYVSLFEGRKHKQLKI
ncbi:MAG: histidinol-phosphatase HisJ family protein [Clostridiales bacterium]|nr:histidinol-phosphatase HisJ family protein [Clostridiales bacterium]